LTHVYPYISHPFRLAHFTLSHWNKFKNYSPVDYMRLVKENKISFKLPKYKVPKLEWERKEFEISARYETLLTVLLFSIPFSGLAPAVYVMIFIAFLISYAVQKITLFHYGKVTTIYSDIMIQKFILYFKAFILVKFFVSCWMFPRQEIFPEDGTLAEAYEVQTAMLYFKQMKRVIPLLVCFGIAILACMFEKTVMIIMDKMERLSKFYWMRFLVRRKIKKLNKAGKKIRNLAVKPMRKQ